MGRRIENWISQSKQEMASLSDWLRLVSLREPDEGDRIPADAEIGPFAHEGGRPSVLCIHGFGGVPSEVQLAVEAARKEGLAASAPLLAGHGTIPSDLAPTRFDDWVRSARSEFDALRKQGPVIVVGLSLGSLVATQLALEAPGAIAGIAILSGAFRLGSPFPGLLLDLVDRLKLPDFYVPRGVSDIRRADGLAAHIAYNLQPAHAAISILRAGAALEQELHRLHHPVLILHGARDRTCPIEGALKWAGRLRARDRRFVVLPESGHIVTRDLDRDRALVELREFFAHVKAQQLAH